MTRIYKRIVISFFQFLYKKIILTSQKKSKNYLYKSFKLKNLLINIYKIKNCRLYTNTLDVSVIKNNELINGPSLQIRNNLNSNLKKNSAFINGTPKFYKKVNNRVFSLLTGVDSDTNYYHWFFDCLPKYFFFKKFFKFNKSDFFLVPNSKKNYQKKTLKILGIKNYFNANEIKHFKINELIITNFTNFQDDPPLEIINFIKNSFLKRKKLKSKNYKLFLNRTGQSSLYRDIINKNIIFNYLRKKNFKIINPDKLNFMSQIRIFNNAKLIVGVHGAAFTNILFCRKNVRIFELKSFNSNNYTLKNLAKKLNLNFKSLYFKPIKSSINNRSWNSKFFVELKRLSKYF